MSDDRHQRVIRAINHYKKRPSYDEIKDGNVRQMVSEEWNPHDPAANFNHDVKPQVIEDPTAIAAVDAELDVRRASLGKERPWEAYDDWNPVDPAANFNHAYDGSATPEQEKEYEAWKPHDPALGFNRGDKDAKVAAASKSKPKSGGGGSRGAGGGAGGNGSPSGNSQVDPDWARLAGEAGEKGELPEHEQAAYDKARAAILKRETSGIRLKPLAALMDSWYGGNLSSAAKEPYTKEEQEEELSSLDMKIAARKTKFQEDAEQRRADLLEKLARATSKAKEDALLHKYRKLELQLAEQRVKAAGGEGGSSKADKEARAREDKAWQQWATTLKGVEALKDLTENKYKGESVATLNARVRARARALMDDGKAKTWDEAFAMSVNDVEGMAKDASPDGAKLNHRVLDDFELKDWPLYKYAPVVVAGRKLFGDDEKK